MSLTFGEDLCVWFDFFVHKILTFAIANVLVFEEVKVITREVVKFVLHLPYFRLFNLSFCYWKWVGLAFRFS